MELRTKLMSGEEFDVFAALPESAKASTVFGSMTSIVFVLCGQNPALMPLKLLIITEICGGTPMIRIPTQRPPTHPGEMLLEEFLRPLGLSQREVAEAIHVPYQRFNEIINQRRGITPGMALRLAKFFGMSPDFWMNMQLRWDLYHAQQLEMADLETIHPYVPTGSDS